MNHAFLQLLVAPWALCCSSGVDDGLATLAGAARLAENAEAVKKFQAMQMTLRLQYDLIVHNLVTVAMHGGGTLTTLVLGSSLLGCMPGLSTIGVTLALHGMVTFFRFYYMPRIDNWQQRQENANRLHGAEALPVLSAGLPSDYRAMRQRHDAQLAELSRRVAYSRLLRNGFEFIEAALLVWVFGLRNNKVNQLGYAALSTVAAGRNINVSHTRIRGARGEFIKQFIAPPLAPCVDPSRLQVYLDGKTPRPLGEMLDAIAAAQPGLWEIRGDNGSGKSTLQRLAKERCGLDAIYQPAKPAFSRGGRLLATQSTGEAMRDRIQEILKDRQEHQKVLLFDEPTAPLSPDWRRAIRKCLKELAETCCVVVINHDPQED